MDTLVDDIWKIGEMFYLNEDEKYEVYTRAVDQIYRAAQELEGPVEEWTEESIAEAYKKTGALSLTDLARQVHEQSVNTLESIRSMLARAVEDIRITASHLERQWPPVSAESRSGIENSARLIRDCEKEIIAIDMHNWKNVDKDQLSYFLKTLEFVNENLDLALNRDKQYQEYFSTREEQARNHIAQLVQTIGEQKGLEKDEQEILLKNGFDILYQIKQSYINGQANPREVLQVLEKLSKIDEVVDINVTNVSAENIQQVQAQALTKMVGK